MKLHDAESKADPKKWEFVIIVSLYASLITAVFTLPLIFQWRTHIPGFALSDGINHAWYAWWYQHALFDLGQSPAEISMIYHPYTYSHPLMVATPWARFLPSLVIYLGLPMQEMYNIHLFLSYVLAWVFMSLLCLELTKDQQAAIIGGAIFAFFPGRNMHTLSGHLTQILTYAYPLLILTLLRVWQQPTLKRGIWFGIALILAATIDLMPLAYFAVPMTGIMLLYFLVTDRARLLSPAMLKSLGLGFLLAALVVIPLLLPLVRQSFQGNLSWYEAEGLEDFSADLISIILPPPGHPLSQSWQSLRNFSEDVYSYGASYTEAVVYAGWITLIFAILGVVKMRRQQRDIKLWVIVALVASILALGPTLRIAGQIITIGADKTVTLPYYLFTKLPLLSWGRTPARFNFTAVFAIAILATYGLAWLFSHVKRSAWRLTLMAALLLFVILDSKTNSPWPMLDLTVPDFYKQIMADQEAGAVLDLPSDSYMADKYAMLYQTVHLRPITAGRAYRIPPDVIEFREALAEAIAKGDTEILQQNNIAYVVLQRQFLTPDELTRRQQQLSNLFGEPIYQDNWIIAFNTGF
jgi:hypothetical protein